MELEAEEPFPPPVKRKRKLPEEELPPIKKRFRPTTYADLLSGMTPLLQQIGYVPRPKPKSVAEYTTEDVDDRLDRVIYFIENQATRADYPLLIRFMQLLLTDPTIQYDTNRYLQATPDELPAFNSDPRAALAIIRHAYIAQLQLSQQEQYRRKYQFYTYWKQLVFDVGSEIQREQQRQQGRY